MYSLLGISLFNKYRRQLLQSQKKLDQFERTVEKIHEGVEISISEREELKKRSIMDVLRSAVYSILFPFQWTFETYLFRQALVFILVFLLAVFVSMVFTFKDLATAKNYFIIGGIVANLLLPLILICHTLKAVVVLVMPPLFIGQLRKILLFTILISAIQGPATNFISNFQSVSVGLGCVQESMVTVAAELREEANLRLRQMPYEKAVELLHNITEPLKEMNRTVREFEDSITRLWVAKREFMAKIKSYFQAICEESLSPYYRCVNFIDGAMIKCKATFSEWMCFPVAAAKWLCEMARFIEHFCELSKAMKEKIKDGATIFMQKNLDKFVSRAKQELIVDILNRSSHRALEYQHDFNAKTEFKFSIKPLKDDLKNQADKILGWLDIVTTVLSYLSYILLALAFLKAVKFAYDYNKKLGPKSNFIYDSSLLEAVDKINESIFGFTVLPLQATEKSEFVTFTSLSKANKKEKGAFKALILTLIFLAPTLIIVVFDLASYFVFSKGYDFIHSNETQLPKVDWYKLKVGGSGFISELLQSMLESFQPVSEKTDEFLYQVKQCIQEPNPPAKDSMIWMGIFAVICIILCFAQPYIGRIQHLIARHYWPSRYRIRQHYLYETILDSREKKIRLLEKKSNKEDMIPDVKYNEADLLATAIYTCVKCQLDGLQLSDENNTYVCKLCRSVFCGWCYHTYRLCSSCQGEFKKIDDEHELASLEDVREAFSMCNDEDGPKEPNAVEKGVQFENGSKN